MKESTIKQAKHKHALQSRPFALLWIGQTVSGLGDGVFVTALIWQALLLTGSGAALSAVMVARNLPLIVFLPLGGVLADRLPRHRIMLWSDGGRAIIVLFVALLGLLHLLQLWHLIALAALFSAVDSFFTPAYGAIPPLLVETEALPSANALTGTSQQVSQLIGPLLGAGFIAVWGTASAFAFDGVSFVFSTACLLGVHLPRDWKAPKQEGQQGYVSGVFHDIWEGLVYILQSKWLWTAIFLISFVNMGMSGSVVVALPKLIYTVYKTGVWALGMLSSLIAGGLIVSMMVVGHIPGLRRRGIVASLGISLIGLGLLCFTLPAALPFALIYAGCGSVCLGLGLGVNQVIWATLMQERIPEDKLGRVSSIDMLLSLALLPIGYVPTGILTDRIGPVWVFAISGVICVISSMLALSVREVRQIS